MPDNPENRVLTEKALREYAEREIPNAEDPWPGIRQRIQAIPSRREAGPRPEPERASAPRPGRRWPPRLVPGTPLGYALAILSVLILAVGVYAASGPIRGLSQQGLPGGVGSGERSGSESQSAPDEQGVTDEWAEDLLRQTAPALAEADLDVRLNETRTVGGIRVTLERAYADEDNVVIVYSASGWNNQPAQAPGPAVLSLTRLTDDGDTTFESLNGFGVVTDPADQSIKVASEATVTFFDPSERLESPGRHDFQVSMELDTSPGQSNRRDGGSAGQLETITFDFTVPVRELDVIDVGQTVEANGIRMTLDRVENSPARTRAFLCMDPPQDEKYTWLPLVERTDIAPGAVFENESLRDIEPENPTGCVGYNLLRPLYDKPGVHSFTVTEIEGRARDGASPKRTVRGPWNFEFEIPDP